MKCELLGYISNINVAKWSSTLFFFPVIAAAKILTVTAAMFALLGIQRETLCLKVNFISMTRILAVAGNVSGIGNIATFAIPETQMQDRSVKSYTQEIRY